MRTIQLDMWDEAGVSKVYAVSFANYRDLYDHIRTVYCAACGARQEHVAISKWEILLNGQPFSWEQLSNIFMVFGNIQTEM